MYSAWLIIINNFMNVLKVRWLPGGHIGFGGGLLNSMVHVVMYSYYLLAALEVPQKYLW